MGPIIRRDAAPRPQSYVPCQNRAGSSGEPRGQWRAAGTSKRSAPLSHCPRLGRRSSRRTLPTSLLERWFLDERQWPAGAGQECAGVLGEEEQGGPCPIDGIDQPGTHGPAMFKDEPHRSFQPKRFESVHPHALKSAPEDSGMYAGGLCLVCHPVGGAAAEGGQSCHGRLVITGQQRFQHMPFHGHPRLDPAVQQPSTATPATAPARWRSSGPLGLWASGQPVAGTRRSGYSHGSEGRVPQPCHVVRSTTVDDGRPRSTCAVTRAAAA